MKIFVSSIFLSDLFLIRTWQVIIYIALSVLLCVAVFFAIWLLFRTKKLMSVNVSKNADPGDDADYEQKSYFRKLNSTIASGASDTPGGFAIAGTAREQENPAMLPVTEEEILEYVFSSRYAPMGVSRKAFYMSGELMREELSVESRAIRELMGKGYDDETVRQIYIPAIIIKSAHLQVADDPVSDGNNSDEITVLRSLLEQCISAVGTLNEKLDAHLKTAGKRGRPRKARTSEEQAVKRGRGRPRKPVDLSAPPVEKRGRGRPKKSS